MPTITYYFIRILNIKKSESNAPKNQSLTQALVLFLIKSFLLKTVTQVTETVIIFDEKFFS